MIPKNQAGVLPPFIDTGTPLYRSPYKSNIIEFVTRYAQSHERITLLKGLLKYRKELRDIGIKDGFQWLDGSFVEDVESNRDRPPADIDIVTFATPPTTNTQGWEKVVTNNKEILEKFQCDAHFINLDTPPKDMVNLAIYWFGVFSYQTDSQRWKGIVQVPIICSDEEALKILEAKDHV